ncbi:FadR/GntR family transcriptional regulator [Rhizobium paknamense]|uniref:DNA-binding FadR family transcriptional regulator n=1 Tax=Rhizobium paknamense TaxID=1206817 RepID=A0ABU0IKY4_9HYPH|nr:FadR/GntR family transcriptional regulator [Rhizobium paknamense]MDQ0457854.1 DNA-binding FadR family transcriptional regulator [Rhizobium paknamense]
MPNFENSNLALDRLRELFARETPEAGSKLPTERNLADMLGVSRRAIRRALEVLEAEGLVWRRQGSGTFAGARPVQALATAGLTLSGCDPLEVMEVRLRLEPQLAQLAAMRATPESVEAMYQLAQKITESDDADAQELWDGALHRRIAQCAGNRLFLTLFDLVNQVRQEEAWRTMREQARYAFHSLEMAHQQHLSIIDAIANRDAMGAGEAMRSHLLVLHESLTRITSCTLEELSPGRGTTARATGL